MVGHKAVAVKDDSKLPEHLLEGVEKELPVSITVKDALAFVASGREMVVGAFELDTDGAGHGTDLYQVKYNVSTVTR